MGIVYFGDNLLMPSVLWMRRMLEGLERDVATLVTENDPGAFYTSRYPTVVVNDGPSLLLWKIARQLGIIDSIPRTAAAVRPFVRAMEREDVSSALVHYLTSAARFREVWRRCPKPVFVHCHGWDVAWDLREGPEPGTLVHDRDYRQQVRDLPDHVHFIANSLCTIERLRHVGIGEDRIHLKYLGVPVADKRPERRYKGDNVTILYLGRLIDCKGPDLVIDAFSSACDLGLQGRLLMAGDGPERRLCELARERSPHKNRIKLLGVVDGATGERLRSEADIFTAHNRLGPRSGQEEAFGVSIAEAMAVGIPVVTGNNGSLPEVYKDGVQGILFEPGDVDAHARSFLRLAADPVLRCRMGQAGWVRVRDHFSIQRETSALRTILGLPA
jgi:colanic acid/amylovoran biosynthesis glycosyltransferase